MMTEIATGTAVDRPHLLIADDDADIRDLVTAQLMREGYALSAAGDVSGIRATLAAGIVDLIVLDLGLPDGDGLTLCRELRSEGYAGAIIMVTARDSAIDRVLGLELGACSGVARAKRVRAHRSVSPASGDGGST
jgi:two-component system OmpR family response regulator